MVELPACSCSYSTLRARQLRSHLEADTLPQVAGGFGCLGVFDWTVGTLFANLPILLQPIDRWDFDPIGDQSFFELAVDNFRKGAGLANLQVRGYCSPGHSHYQLMLVADLFGEFFPQARAHSVDSIWWSKLSCPFQNSGLSGRLIRWFSLTAKRVWLNLQASNSLSPFYYFKLLKFHRTRCPAKVQLPSRDQFHEWGCSCVRCD